MIEPRRPNPEEPRFVSKCTDAFVIELPLDAAVHACQAAIRAGNWKVMNSDGRNFVIKEQFGLVNMLFSYPARAAILLRELSDAETRVELHGAIFGFGPLQARRVRAAVERLHVDIRQAANAMTADA